MLYLSLNEQNTQELLYYCRKCDFVEQDFHAERSKLSVLKTSFRKCEQSFQHVVNPYTKYDPTLPRKSHILCPNAQCTTNVDGSNREILCIRYDHEQLKYIYLCATCDTTWKASVRI